MIRNIQVHKQYPTISPIQEPDSYPDRAFQMFVVPIYMEPAFAYLDLPSMRPRQH